MSRRERGALLASLIVAVLLGVAPVAQAQFGVEPEDWIAQVFGTDVQVFDVASDSYGTEDGIYDQAGGHPWKGITDFTMRLDGSGTPQGGNAANVRVDVPVGLVPNPTIYPRCLRTVFDSDPSLCPPDSQIGIEELTIKEDAAVAQVRVPLYNVGINSDEVSLFGFHPADAAPLVPLIGSLADLNPVYIVGGVRDELALNPVGGAFGPHDLGLYFTIDDAPETPTVLRSKLTFWGVPGDPIHDPQRDNACVTTLEVNGSPVPLPAEPCTNSAGASATLPVRELPFLSNPTKCGGVPLLTRLSLWSHSDPQEFATVVGQTPTIIDPDDSLPKDGAQHCDIVPFDPAFEVTPDTTQADSPVGPLVRLSAPQDGLHDKDMLVTSHVEDVSVTMPPGMTINPSVANGLEACTDAQLAASTGTVGGDECPEASKVGTVDVKSPLLPDSVTGSAFVGQPLTGDMYRLFVTLEGRGVSVRLKGSVDPDPTTGQLTATFPNNPEQPFDTFDVDFEDGPRAPLATPLDCGSKTASATLTPWSGNAPATPSSAPFTISGAGCPPAFAPTFGAGTASPLAGAFSPLSVQIDRADRNQFLSGVRVEVPPGFAGMISRVTQCADAQAAAGACPALSRVGTVHTRSGAGSEPFALSGPVYLSGPYKGGSFGLVAVIRAIAGPYDLGTVIVRQAIYVDPNDAHLSVISDPLPRILEGVPIRLRLARVVMDKPGFTFNPTSCGAKRLTSRIHSTQGAGATPAATPFSIGGCERLPLDPKLALSLTGPRQMAEGKHPGVNAALTQKAGESNIKGARVTLPLSLALDPDNARALCEYDAGLRGDCPASSIVGQAKAVSPALNRPLTGPVHFVKGVRFGPTGNRIRTLPTFFVPLRGEVPINLRSQSSIGSRGRLVNTFTSTPDAPVSRFDLKLKGGRGGILVVTSPRGACRGRSVASAHFDGHNGKAKDAAVALTRPCRNPHLKIRRKSWRGERIVVRGVVAKAAKRKVSVTARCGKTRVVKAKRPKRGRWKVALPARGRCGDASRARLVVKYPGGDQFRPATRRRAISRSAP